MTEHQSKGKEKVRSRDSTSMPGDVPEHQNPHAFWKIKDKIGWEHGIMVNNNRQHWKCKYCSMVWCSGGVSGLKRHLVGGSKKVKKCLAVPEDVSAQIRKLMDDRKEKRQKRTILKGLNNVKSRRRSDDPRNQNDLLNPGLDVLTGVKTNVPEEATNQTNAELKTAHEPASITGSEPWDLIISTSHGLISDVPKDSSAILRESTQGSMVLAHVPGGTCYCYFCTLERAKEMPEYQEMMLRSLHRNMVRVYYAFCCRGAYRVGAFANNEKVGICSHFIHCYLSLTEVIKFNRVFGLNGMALLYCALNIIGSYDLNTSIAESM